VSVGIILRLEGLAGSHLHGFMSRLPGGEERDQERGQEGEEHFGGVENQSFNLDPHKKHRNGAADMTQQIPDHEGSEGDGQEPPEDAEERSFRQEKQEHQA